MAELMGIKYPEFKQLCGWANLYGDETRSDRPRDESRARADHLRRSFVGGQIVVLLGIEVAKAFGVEKQEKYELFELAPGVKAGRMIHPSEFHWRMRKRQAELWGPAREFALFLFSYARRHRNGGA